MPVPRGWHAGEVEAQEARGYADDLWGADPPYDEGLTPFYATFFEQLPFIPLTTLDGKGRPWASLIAGIDGREGFIRSSSASSDADRALNMSVTAPEGLPLRFCLDGRGKPNGQEILSATVGVMLHNRRRNKLEGFIKDWNLHAEQNMLELDLGVQFTMGNCPKYINRRMLTSKRFEPKLLASQYPEAPRGQTLPQVALDIVAEADLIYLATKHTGNPSAYPFPDPDRVGMNHRGGKKGFVRHYFDEAKGKSCIVVPDFSGNRFMQSIGNLVKDPVAGLAIPHYGYRSADGSIDRPTRVLHVTGTTEVLVGEEAKKVMRGVQALVKVYVDAYTVLEGALPIVVDGTKPTGATAIAKVRAAAEENEKFDVSELTEEDCIDWSPYNPPVRLLNVELADPATAKAFAGEQLREATLNAVHFWTPELATFEWSLPVGGSSEGYVAGQYVIMDGADLLDTRVKLYKHMAQFPGGEREINDDGVRSWTVSSRPALSEDGKELFFSTTVRRKPRGAASPGLFHQGWRLKKERERGNTGLTIKIPVLGFEGAFVLPPTSKGDGAQMLYMAHGIGLTPILAHLEQLAASGAKADAIVVLAARKSETHIHAGLISRAVAASRDALRLRVIQVERDAADDDGSGFQNVTPDMLSPLPAKDVVPSNTEFCVISDGSRINKGFFLAEERRAGLTMEDLASRTVYICGTPAFDRECRKALRTVAAQVVGAQEQKIISESFTF